MRVDLNTLPPFIRKAIEYRPWMRDDSPYVAYQVRTGSSYVSKKPRGMETSRIVREFITDTKAHAHCVVCGEDDPICLHFHHRDPETKSFDVSSAAKYPLEAVKAEIVKCDVLCANCHAKVHGKRLVRLDHFVAQQEASIA